MRKIIFLLFVILVSCNQNRTKFNSKKWVPYETGVLGENRKNMLFDFSRNVIKINLTNKKNIDSLIGASDSFDKNDNSFTYLIYEKYGWDIDPEGYIYLKLFFNKDSIVEHWKIEETTFNP